MTKDWDEFGKETKVTKEVASKLRISREKKTKEKLDEPPDVTAGPLGQVISYAFNPSRDKIREMTVIDRVQGRLLPLLDVINLMWGYAIEVATYRLDAAYYKEIYGKDMPEMPDIISEYTHRLAQWSKSIGGKNLEKAIDMALAEIESKTEGLGEIGSEGDNY